MEKRVRFTGGTASEASSPEGLQDRKFVNHFNSYYDGVVAFIRGTDSIQIFGPGEAKGELRKPLEHEGRKGHVLAIETVDKMTDHNIAAKVREHFLS